MKSKADSAVAIASRLLDYVKQSFSDGHWNKFDVESLEDIANVAIRGQTCYPDLLQAVWHCAHDAPTWNHDDEDLQALSGFRDDFDRLLAKHGIVDVLAEAA